MLSKKLSCVSMHQVCIFQKRSNVHFTCVCVVKWDRIGRSRSRRMTPTNFGVTLPEMYSNLEQFYMF